MQFKDTIASVATSMTDAGIGIIRISGADAVLCAEKVLERPLVKRLANTIRFNRVLDECGSMIDEALVSVMRAPFSYTGEDVVEINTHGGRQVMEYTLQRLLSVNPDLLRLAKPGEFTERAFLNGKMDLTKAEAVQDIIGAKNDFAMKNAAKQLDGMLEKKVRSMREAVLHEAAFMEAALDDPDVYEEQLEGYGERLSIIISDLIKQTDQILKGYNEGILRKDGIACVILGAPNTGKSTLLNLLAKQERAIVTDLPGTTRDVLEEVVYLDDLMLRLIDTAGIRRTTDRAEAIGIARAKENAMRADLILLVVDASEEADSATRELFAFTRNKPTVVLLNKTDLLSGERLEEMEQMYRRIMEDVSNDSREQEEAKPFWIRTSFTNGTGIKQLCDCLKTLFFRGEITEKEACFLTNLRQKEAIEEARYSLNCVLDAVAGGMTEDLYLPDLMDAYTSLGFVIGEAVEDDLLEKIFSSFCLGK